MTALQQSKNSNDHLGAAQRAPAKQLQKLGARTRFNIMLQMPTTTRVDPYGSNNFRVEIDGITASDFMEVSGIEAEVTVVDYRSGTDKVSTARKLPGETVYSNIVLKRGMTTDLSLWNWMKLGISGTLERKNMSVVLVDAEGKELLRWNFVNAWPVKWSGPLLNSEVSDVAIETLEIAHEGVSLQA